MTSAILITIAIAQVFLVFAVLAGNRINRYQQQQIDCLVAMIGLLRTQIEALKVLEAVQGRDRTTEKII